MPIPACPNLSDTILGCTPAFLTSPVDLRIYYTNAETTDARIDESTLKMYRWDGSNWVVVPDSGVNTDENYVWARLTSFSAYAPMGDPSGCFIATAAYGTPMAEEIQVLREFRDQYLLTNPVGEALVEFYYKVSPPIAEFITEHPALKPVVRAGLVPAIAMSRVAVNTTLAQKMAILSSMVLLSALLVVWLRRRAGKGSTS